MSLQIFVSYSRDDDDLPPAMQDGRRKGFVGSLFEHLAYQFKVNGPFRPILWRDTKGIERGERFEPVLEEAIRKSDLLLVVFSRNWMLRPYCLWELEKFVERWGAEAQKRIIVATKHNIPVHMRPPHLRGQEGYNFFTSDRDATGDGERPFFDRGEVLDRGFFETIEAMATYIEKLARKCETPSASGADNPSPQIIYQVKPIAQPPAAAKLQAKADKPARTVYVAKPAADMKSTYARVVEELQRRGYGVVPPAEVDIPHDSSATDFVDTALQGADLSVHLLGEKLGYAPEDCEPIVKMQLYRAAKRAVQADAESKKFLRLVWAPKLLVSGQGGDLDAAERDPLSVLERLHGHFEFDKVDGNTASRFIDFLFEHVDNMYQPPPNIDVLGDASLTAYIYHTANDIDYVVELGSALLERNIQPVTTVLDGDPGELLAFHRQNLRNCDAIVLCWATAPETWVRAATNELRDWRKLNREKGFLGRLIVAMPPPGQSKNLMKKLPPREEIDKVVDLTDKSNIAAETFAPVAELFRPA